ncbi:DUF4349 domain-containing protein [Promicromonospora thailandica]|uniref:DUF4349 domain-containing protein n=1 Tax=Promicromonospora thailandica TaxID=765201 RepID=A0A9X2JU00_9MICO|nr:DUF4349 domain-containing protein [Promicromonospora thailandica]MCP2262937.1 protein of unknown function (DUF4349) [Promicromonospora thailandica]BFF18289.1 DUF4349 domain-containing protein [Promicromonospora thailandica]
MKRIRSALGDAGLPARRPVHTLLAAATTGLLVAALAGCSGPGAGDSGGESGGDGAAQSEVMSPDAARSDAVADAVGAVGLGDAAEEAVDRELVTTGSATLAVDDPFDAAEEIARLVEEAGGRVESRDEQAPTDDEPGRASMTLRIPADRVSATLDALDQLGDMRDRHVETVDVTGTAQDLDARIEALRTSTDRLRELMADADRTADLIDIEAELSTRQAELDARVAERSRLSDEVAMSTLHVEIVAEGSPAAQARPGGFLGGLTAGWSALVSTFNVVVLVLGAIIPWLALASVVFLVVVGVRRQLLARNRLTGPPPAVEPEPVEP